MCKITLSIVMMIFLVFIPTVNACPDAPGSQTDGGVSDNGNNGSSGDGDGADGGQGAAAGSSSGGTEAAGSSNDANGPLENPCDYYWNWGSAKYRCPPVGD